MYPDFNWGQLGIIGLILACGSLLQSGAGFGFGLFVMPCFLLFADLSVPKAMGLMAASGFIQSTVSVWHLKSHVEWKSLVPLVITGALALLLGVWMLYYLEGLDRNRIRQVVGGVILAILAINLLWKVRPRENVHRWWGVAAIFCSGLVSGLVGVGGPFIVLWVMAHNWPTSKSRGTILAIIAAMIPFQIGFLVLRFGPGLLSYIATGFLFLPMVLIGTAAGFG